MPCLEISLPALNIETKQRLAASLTEVFCASTGHDASIFGIRFFEYQPDQAAVGGKLATADSPYVHFLLYCPRLKRASKQKLASALTEAFQLSVGNQSWVPIIHICEHPYDNVVVNGKLLSDAYEECAQRKFYYELPRD